MIISECLRNQFRECIIFLSEMQEQHVYFLSKKKRVQIIRNFFNDANPYKL